MPCSSRPRCGARRRSPCGCAGWAAKPLAPVSCGPSQRFCGTLTTKGDGMRRSGLVVAVLTLAGCGALRDAFSAHPEVAGTAAGQTLTVARLAELAGRAKKVPLRPEAVSGLTTVYLDYAVFAVALARGRNMDDSALVLEANWPNVAQLRWEHYHDHLVAARAKLTADQTDSAYHAGDVRLFQHILVSVPPSAASTVEQDKKQQAEGLLRQVQAQRGANFSQLAKRYSEDPGSKSRGGYLSAVGRGRFVPAFDTVAWRLAPGAMSGLVRSPFGFHIIRRPPLEEVRDSFRTELETALAVHFDSVYIDSVASRSAMRVRGGAAALVRQAIQDVAPPTQRFRGHRIGAQRHRDATRQRLPRSGARAGEGAVLSRAAVPRHGTASRAGVVRELGRAGAGTGARPGHPGAGRFRDSSSRAGAQACAGPGARSASGHREAEGVALRCAPAPSHCSRSACPPPAPGGSQGRESWPRRGRSTASSRPWGPSRSSRPRSKSSWCSHRRRG